MFTALESRPDSARATDLRRTGLIPYIFPASSKQKAPTENGINSKKRQTAMHSIIAGFFIIFNRKSLTMPHSTGRFKPTENTVNCNCKILSFQVIIKKGVKSLDNLYFCLIIGSYSAMTGETPVLLVV